MKNHHLEKARKTAAGATDADGATVAPRKDADAAEARFSASRDALEAKAEYAATLRRLADWIRSDPDAPLERDLDVADIENAVALIHGKPTEAEEAAYRAFRVHLVNDNPLREEFDRLRAATERAWSEALDGDEESGARLADALELEASYAERLKLDGAGGKCATSHKPPKRSKPQRRTSQWNKTAEDVAKDLTEGLKLAMGGAPMCHCKGCSKKTVEGWDRKHPDAAHPNRWGYYAELRLSADCKGLYYEFVRRWISYHVEANKAFNDWKKQHPHSPKENFRYKPVKRLADTNPERIGRDADGRTFVTPDRDKPRQY